MKNAVIGLCSLELHLSESTSLKAKRSIVKSLLTRLHRTFNVSAAEIDHNDYHQSAAIAIVFVSNSSKLAQQVLTKAISWLETNYPDAIIINQQFEII
jgi:uncharacterized protein YlxP (DUF503 family)